MRSNIKALIFDLDGTLADTIPAITEAINMTMDKLSLPSHTEEEVRTFIGRGPRHLIEQSIPMDLRTKDTNLVNTALEIYNEMYAKTYLRTDKPYDGISNVLTSLATRYKIAVLSNKQDEYVKALVKQLLPEGICMIACGSIDCVPAKPDPYLALDLAQKLGIDPCECIMIGDSCIDILTAQNAGFKSLSVSWGYDPKTNLINKGAQNIIDAPSELLDYFN